MRLARLKINRDHRGKFLNSSKIYTDEGDYQDWFQGLISFDKISDKTTPISPPRSRPRFQSGSNRDRCERHINDQSDACIVTVWTTIRDRGIVRMLHIPILAQNFKLLVVIYKRLIDKELCKRHLSATGSTVSFMDAVRAIYEGYNKRCRVSHLPVLLYIRLHLFE